MSQNTWALFTSQKDGIHAANRPKFRRGRGHRLQLEHRERRTVPTEPNVLGPLNITENTLISALNTLTHIPFVGDKLGFLHDAAHHGADFINGFVSQLQSGLVNLPTAVPARDQALRDNIFAA